MTLPISQDDPIYPVFFKVFNKQWKYHLIKNKDIGNSLCIGNPGFGKTTCNRRECELRYENNHKIICLYDAGRCDMAYFMFPSVSDFWKKPKVERGKIILPKKYPVELLYPVTSNIPKKLPYNAVPFTIGVSDLDENDIVALVGTGSKDTVKGALNFMKKKIDKDTTGLDYLNIMGHGLKKVEDSDSIKPSHFGIKKLKSDVFLPLINEGLLSSKNSDTAIDIRSIITNKKTMSILILRHCPQNLWGFLVLFFLNHIFKSLSGIDAEKRIKQKTTVVMNEVADLLTADEDAGSSSGSIAKMIEKIAKQYRTGNMYLLMDTQIPQELPDVKDTLNRIYVFNSGVSEVQKVMEIMGISFRSGQINSDDLMIIPRLPKGYYYLFDRVSGVSIHKLLWTRSRTYLDGEDFYDIYNKINGISSYINIAPILDKLETEREKSEEIWNYRKNMINKKNIDENDGAEDDFDEEVDKEELFEEKTEETKIKEENIEIKSIEVKEDVAVPKKKKTDWAAFKKIIKTI